MIRATYQPPSGGDDDLGPKIIGMVTRVVTIDTLLYADGRIMRFEQEKIIHKSQEELRDAQRD